MSTWGPLVLIAASASLIVALVRLWRRKIRNTPPEPPAPAPETGPPFGVDRPAPLRPPPAGFVCPPGVDAALVVWWQRVEGAGVFWLCREAGHQGAWWVSWHAVWRRGLPPKLWAGDAAHPKAEHHHGLGPVVSWQGTEHRPLIAADTALWRELLQCGLPVALHRGEGAVALRVPADGVRDAFDLGTLAAMAALLEARASDDLLPTPADIPAVALRVTHARGAVRVYGDLPPFGGMRATPSGWRFGCTGVRDGAGALVDLWPHDLRVSLAEAERAPTRATGDEEPGAAESAAAGVPVDVSDHGPGLLVALDGDTRRLSVALGEGPLGEGPG